MVSRAASGQGYVAIDDIEFVYIELCELEPPNAKPVPTTLPPTTTTTTTSTVEPTEPDSCKQMNCPK